MTLAHPRVDVVMPAFNAGRYIESALESVAAQSMPVARIIVIDDGSTDDTAVRVKAFGSRHPGIELIYRYQDNAGISAARNRGLAIAHSHFVALLDADDLWAPDKLARQIALFAQPADERLGVVYCDYGLITEAGEPQPYPGSRLDPTLRGEVYERLLRANLVAGSASAVLIRRDCLEHVGLFDETLKEGAEDWDLWLRLARHYTFDFVPAKLVFIRRHPHQSQKNEVRMIGGELRFLDKLYRTGQMRRYHLSRFRRRLAFGRVDAARLAGFDVCHPYIQRAISGWGMVLISLLLRASLPARNLVRAVRRYRGQRRRDAS